MYDIPAVCLCLLRSYTDVQQQLYVRLFLRKHQWLRVAKFRYDYISEDLTPVITGLVGNGFLCTGQFIFSAQPPESTNILLVPKRYQPPQVYTSYQIVGTPCVFFAWLNVLQWPMLCTKHKRLINSHSSRT